MRRSAAVLLLVIPLIFWTPLAEAASQAYPKLGTADGTLIINGKPIRLNYAYALAQPNTFEKDKTDIAVLLTEKPLAADALKDIEEMDAAVRGVHGYAHFEINEDGRPIREVLDHPLLGGQTLQMSGFTHASFKSRVFGKDKDRIEGTFTTAKIEDFMGSQYEIKVDFAAAVVKATIPEPLPDARTGKALPADGGEPGKAFMILHQAIIKKDMKTVIKLNAAMPDPLPPEDQLREGLDILAEMEPVDPKITGAYINQKGDRASLHVLGLSDGQKQYGTIEVVKTGIGWRVLRQIWSDTASQ